MINTRNSESGRSECTESYTVDGDENKLHEEFQRLHLADLDHNMRNVDDDATSFKKEKCNFVKSKCSGKAILRSLATKYEACQRSIQQRVNMHGKSKSRNKDGTCCKKSTKQTIQKQQRVNTKGMYHHAPTASHFKQMLLKKPMMPPATTNLSNGKLYCDPKLVNVENDRCSSQKAIAHYPYVIYSSNPCLLCTIAVGSRVMETKIVNRPFLQRFGKLFCSLELNPGKLLASVLDENEETNIMELLIFAISQSFLKRISFPCYFPKSSHAMIEDGDATYELSVVDCSCRKVRRDELEIWFRLFSIDALETAAVNAKCAMPKADQLKINQFNVPLQYERLPTTNITPEKEQEYVHDLHKRVSYQFLYQLTRLVACRCQKMND